MTKVAFTMTGNSISVLLDGRMRVIPRTQKNFPKIEKLIKRINGPKAIWENDKAHEKRLNKLRELIDIPVYLEKATSGRVKVTDKGVLFNGQPIHNTIAKQIMRFLHEGHDVLPLANFLDKVMDNPNPEIANELYEWIESGKFFSIAPDGDFYAYKKVAADYSSIHTGPNGEKLYNQLGTRVSMPREEVDADRTRTCSTGLHFCSFDYLEHYGWGGEEKVVIVKINPVDVVSIPDDYDYTKGRACGYEIYAEVPADELDPSIFKAPVQERENYALVEYAQAQMSVWDEDDEDDYYFDHWEANDPKSWWDDEPTDAEIEQQIEDAEVEAAVTAHEGDPWHPNNLRLKRTIPVVDRDGKVIRYIEE